MVELVIQVRVPYTGTGPNAAAAKLVKALRQVLERIPSVPGVDTQASSVAVEATVPALALSPILAIVPSQLNQLDDVRVTVRYPVGQDTVLSVQPNGDVETRPPGTAGPYEVARVDGDRVVFAPTGPTGAAYLFPFAATLP